MKRGVDTRENTHIHTQAYTHANTNARARDGQRAHTENMSTTRAVFQEPMSALNAVFQPNACAPTTRGPQRTAPKPNAPEVPTQAPLRNASRCSMHHATKRASLHVTDMETLSIYKA